MKGFACEHTFAASVTVVELDEVLTIELGPHEFLLHSWCAPLPRGVEWQMVIAVHLPELKCNKIVLQKPSDEES